ncbi:DUF2079 domain-containing protein [Plantactinospora sp. S1510]|uniref:DUF2079 domain-containing protein n=1 Tax=Plantactinospora alkalitolerans TaxID=2789879 RepID=A0ABS0GX20_9ACTN|nr:DUF2079 domain-containing protein [Plantactinospora alkalitolerans]MBF9130437.1 DUF2079 domain-containing protein [Plantactinospora alkalitolerans]
MPLSSSALAGPPPQPSAPQPSTAPTPDRPNRRRVDLLVALVAIVGAVWVTSGLWLDPNGRAITVNSSDQALFEWLLAYGAHALSHGQNPFFTDLLNVPDGVNLAVNTSVTVYAVVFAPLTYLIGPPATFLVVLTANLAGTAFGWYWLLSRHLVRSAPAAVLGGLFIGFAPGMVAHANGHLNWSAGWVAPMLLWGVLRLRQPGRWLRNGILLGVLVAVAFSIAAEGLFFTALACAVFLGTWALDRGRRVEARTLLPTFLRGLGITAAVAFALLAYPLWMHFLGPQRFHGTGFDPVIHAEDIAAYGAYPQRTLAGLAGLDTSLAPNPTEENSFLGLPLLVLAVACFGLLWRHADPVRRATLRALGVTALVFTVLSWGPRVKIFEAHTDIPLPYALLGHLPVFNAALPSRLALVVAPVVGLLLAHAVDLLRSIPLSRRARTAWLAGFTVALLPLLPATLLTVHRDPVPEFITSGTWRQYVSPGGVLTPLPLTLDLAPDGQRWQAYALAHRQGEFAVPAGFFLGPGGPDGRGRIGPVPRPTDALLMEVARTGERPTITDADRTAARADLRYWRVEVMVLTPEAHGAKFPIRWEAVLDVATELFGQPERVSDVWLWRVSP